MTKAEIFVYTIVAAASASFFLVAGVLFALKPNIEKLGELGIILIVLFSGITIGTIAAVLMTCIWRGL